jgi:hypothetical protein
MDRQREAAPFILNVVDGDKDPRLPLEERLDLKRTRELRAEVQHHIVDKFGRAPRMQQSVHDQFQPQIVMPSKAEIDEANAWKSENGFRTCQECREFDYQLGQEYLANGGAEYLQRAFGGKYESSWLGDWTKYGWCRVKDSITPCITVAARCEHYREAHGSFLRSVGGLIRRVRGL